MIFTFLCLLDITKPGMFSNKIKLSFKHSYFRVDDFTSRSIKIIVAPFFKMLHILLLSILLCGIRKISLLFWFKYVK